MECWVDEAIELEDDLREFSDPFGKLAFVSQFLENEKAKVGMEEEQNNQKMCEKRNAALVDVDHDIGLNYIPIDPDYDDNRNLSAFSKRFFDEIKKYRKIQNVEKYRSNILNLPEQKKQRLPGSVCKLAPCIDQKKWNNAHAIL